MGTGREREEREKIKRGKLRIDGGMRRGKKRMGDGSLRRSLVGKDLKPLDPKK